jgi:hypothetical protein
VLTFRCAEMVSYSARLRAAAVVLAVIVASALTWRSAHADGVAVGGCVGWHGYFDSSFNCAVRWGEATNPYVRLVPSPMSEAERQRAGERDQKWERRCRPVVFQDMYGVPRYRYAAPGCAFGVIE